MPQTATKPNTLEWADLWTAMERDQDKWHRTTKAMYWNQLEVVWPARWIGNGFMVGEPLGNLNGRYVHAAFKQVGNRYYAKYMTMQEFESEFEGGRVKA